MGGGKMHYAIVINPDEDLKHYGMPRKSGRYPWGSGERPYQSGGGPTRKEYDQALKGKKRAASFTKERTLPKGTTVYRSGVNLNEPLKGGPAYISYVDVDRDLYRGVYFQETQPGKRVYEKTMKLKDDIKIPSRDTYKQAITDVIKENPDMVVSTAKHYLDRWIPKIQDDEERMEFYKFDSDGKIVLNEEGEKYKKILDVEAKVLGIMDIDYAYSKYAMTFGPKNDIKNAVIEKLKKQGYDAMVDEGGVGGSTVQAVEGIDPIIIFDSSMLDVISTEDVTSLNKIKDYENWTDKARYSYWRNGRKWSNETGGVYA